MSEPGSRSPTCSASGDFEALLRRIAREEAEAVMRAAARDVPGPAPKFSTLAAYARRQELGVSTLRRWARAAGLRPEPNGRYLSNALDQVVATAGRHPTPAPLDIAAERAKRTAREILERRRPT